MSEKLPKQPEDDLKDHEFPTGIIIPKENPEDWTVETQENREKKLEQNHKSWTDRHKYKLHTMAIVLNSGALLLYHLGETIDSTKKNQMTALAITGIAISTVTIVLNWLKNKYAKKP